MSTLQQLKTYAADVLHVPYAATPDLSALAAMVDAGRTSFAAAALQVERGAIQTTGVAELSYQFFTGATLKPSGLDYLVSPTGPNPNNLNSAYYQSFNIENRYINFAVNLGKNGEGASSFTAAYGALSLSDTVVKAYTMIFGAAPDAAKTYVLLNDQVPNGQGGTYTRAQYFASYGLDGPNGVGTKAALVGWLLAQAAKEDVGVYAQAYDAFIADLAPDNLATFNVDLLATYGTPPASTPGATIGFAANQSVSPTATDASLRSTAGADTITGANGLDAVDSVVAGDGADVVNVAGAVAGYIDGGAGNDRITVGTLNAPVAVLGASNNGTISGGAGDDVITVTQRLAIGAVVDGGAGDDTLVAAIAETDVTTGSAQIKLSGVEHLVISSYANRVDAYNLDLTLDLSGVVGLRDLTSLASGAVKLSGITDGTALVLRGVSAGTTSFTYANVGAGSGRGFHFVGASTVIVHLDGVTTGRAGASPTALVVNNADGPLQLVVDSDSALSALSRFTNSGGFDTSVVVTGLGRLTTSVVTAVSTFDASASAGVTLSHLNAVTAILSGADDQVAADLRQAYAYGVESYTLGAGADVLSVSVNAADTAPAFANMKLTGSTVSDYLRVNDFAKGVDHLDLGATAGGAPLALTASAQGRASLEAALASVSAATPANTTAVFEYGGDTWVYHQDSVIGANTGDGLVRLVGVTGLATGASAGAADIRFG